MKPFHFKQFSIRHHKSTMKVGTDAILLSAWANVLGANTILDIGTGCGVIALIMAARTNAKVDAIELDEISANEAKSNFKNSLYKNRLKIINKDFNEFAIATKNKYDLIISNPPFFTNDLLPDLESRMNARHTTSLSHYKLIKGVISLLNENGKFCLVLPYDIAVEFIKISINHKLHLCKKQIVYPKPDSRPNRINMEFKLKKSSDIYKEEIVIRDINNEHSAQYKNYTKDYLIYS